MKRTITVLLLLFLLLLTSCSAKEATAQPSSPDQTQPSNTAPSSTQSQTTEESFPESSRRYEWIDTDEDGVEEYVPIYEIWEFDLDEIISNSELTQMLFEDPDFDVWDYDIETICSYSELRCYVLDNCDYFDHIEWYDTSHSTCFSEIGYHPVWEQLTVVFRSSGSSYIYYDVPETVAFELIDHSDPGEYYNDYIKGRYECERLE